MGGDEDKPAEDDEPAVQADEQPDHEKSDPADPETQPDAPRATDTHSDNPGTVKPAGESNVVSLLQFLLCGQVSFLTTLLL